MSTHPKVALAHTPSNGDVGKFMWFLFSVRPRHFFLPYFLALPLPFLPSKIPSSLFLASFG